MTKNVGAMCYCVTITKGQKMKKYLLLEEELTAIYEFEVEGSFEITACDCGNTNIKSVYYDYAIRSLVCENCDTFIDPIDHC
jgi:hypothetical protein